jgi:hypothetical protein
MRSDIKIWIFCRTTSPTRRRLSKLPMLIFFRLPGERGRGALLSIASIIFSNRLLCQWYALLRGSALHCLFAMQICVVPLEGPAQLKQLTTLPLGLCILPRFQSLAQACWELRRLGTNCGTASSSSLSGSVNLTFRASCGVSVTLGLLLLLLLPGFKTGMRSSSLG